jgi:hypothetical protein
MRVRKTEGDTERRDVNAQVRDCDTATLTNGVHSAWPRHGQPYAELGGK